MHEEQRPSSESRSSADGAGDGPGLPARAVGTFAALGFRLGGRVADRLGLGDAARTAFDRVLAAPLAEQITRQLIEQGVIERVTAELITGGIPTRVVDQVMASEVPEQVIDRVLTPEFSERVVQRVLDSPGIEPAAVEVIESDLVDELTRRVLDSPEMTMTIERVAESPQVRNALAAQGVGLIGDIGRQLGSLARRLDGAVEIPFRWLFRRGPREGPVVQAGVVSRGLALALDAVVLNGIFFAISAAAALALSFFGGSGDDLSTQAFVAGGVLWCVGAFIYCSIFWTLAGQTPGMRFVRLKLTMLGGGGLTLRESVKRLVGMVLAAIPFFLGYAAILVNEHRRGWQDRIAHTEVSYVLDELMPGSPGPPELRPGPEYHGPGQREPTKG